MYKANNNSTALAKALYNTNKSVRTCAKVIYNICANALYFSRPIVFTLVYAFIHRRGRELPYWRIFRMLYCKLCIIIP